MDSSFEQLLSEVLSGQKAARKKPLSEGSDDKDPRDVLLQNKDHSAELVRRTLAGDRVSQKVLVLAIIPVLRKCVARTLRAKSGCDDGRGEVAMDVDNIEGDIREAMFANNWAKISAWRLDGEANLKTWVTRIARNQTIDVMRRRWPHLVEFDDEEINGRIMADEVQFKESIDIRRRLFEALKKRLSPEGFELFEQLVWLDRPIAEVSEKTGLSADALYQRRRQFLILVREILRELDL